MQTEGDPMSNVQTATQNKAEAKGFQTNWKFVTPVVVAVIIALLPAPAGLPQHAWYYFPLFIAVIVGLMLEPLPGGAIGIAGVTLATLLAPWVLYGARSVARVTPAIPM